MIDLAHIGVALLGVVVVAGMLWDAFETIVLPRTAQRTLKITGLFYRSTWRLWSGVAQRTPDNGTRSALMNIYGSLSFLLLFVVWATGLIFGFALLHWGLRTDISMTSGAGPVTFLDLLYFSGTSFFTLGFGDLTPGGLVGRFLSVFESGLGFAFLAVVIGYLPVFYQAFSRRESGISMLDSRAGAPPSAGELLYRYGSDGNNAALERFLQTWETWSADVLESHISHPLLCYYRSQHEHQSWVAAITVVLDTCALLLAAVDDGPKCQARLTFAMARHAVVDLTQVFAVPSEDHADRLPPAAFRALRDRLGAVGFELDSGPEATAHLRELRAMYEPYIVALGAYLVLDVPAWGVEPNEQDDWQRTAARGEEVPT